MTLKEAESIITRDTWYGHSPSPLKFSFEVNRKPKDGDVIAVCTFCGEGLTVGSAVIYPSIEGVEVFEEGVNISGLDNVCRIVARAPHTKGQYIVSFTDGYDTYGCIRYYW